MPLANLTKEDLAWAVHRMRPPVIDILRNHPGAVFVAGGFVRSCVAGEKINDIDLFCDTPNRARDLAAQVAGVTRNSLHTSENAHTVRTRPYATQFISRWTFTSPEQCIESFDFTIAKAAIWWDGSAWVGKCDERFYADLASKRLVYTSPVREEEAGGSMLRVLKFYQRGYRIPMDSLGEVIARIAASAGDAIVTGDEPLGPIITSLLREVDPDIDPEHQSHLPSTTDQLSTQLLGSTVPVSLPPIYF
jgi:hypothetical protein